MNGKKIFPDFEFSESKFSFDASTFIRKKRDSDNKYFLIPIRMNWDRDHEMNQEIQENKKIDFLKQFVSICYNHLLFYILFDDGEKEDQLQHGLKIGCELDENQQDEYERVIKNVH